MFGEEDVIEEESTDVSVVTAESAEIGKLRLTNQILVFG